MGHCDSRFWALEVGEGGKVTLSLVAYLVTYMVILVRGRGGIWR